MFVVSPSHHSPASFAPHGSCRGRFVVSPAFNPCGSRTNCNNNKTAPSPCTAKKTSSKSDETSRRHHVVTERSPVHHNETDKVATISIDVTGYGVDDVKVQVNDHIVTVTGERKNRLGDTYVIHRRFKLDKKTADEDNMQVHLVDGILDIVVPKKAVNGPRTIPIVTTASSVTTSASETPDLVAAATFDEGAEEEEQVKESSEAAPKSETEDVDEDENVETVFEEEEDTNNNEKSDVHTEETKDEGDDETWEDVDDETTSA